MKTSNLNEFKSKELTEEEKLKLNGGHWAINLAAAVIVFGYQLGKDSYAIHPKSFV